MCGEAIWSYYELIGRRETPFPSAADAGFLLFPLLAGMGLLLWPSAALQGAARCGHSWTAHWSAVRCSC